jgi:hypothetical protein
MPEALEHPEFPDPTAELVLLRVFIEAHLETSPRKVGERFLLVAAEKLASEENMASVFQIRPHAHWPASQRARKQAVALFERYLPTFLARLPPK